SPAAPPVPAPVVPPAPPSSAARLSSNPVTTTLFPALSPDGNETTWLRMAPDRLVTVTVTRVAVGLVSLTATGPARASSATRRGGWTPTDGPAGTLTAPAWKNAAPVIRRLVWVTAWIASVSASTTTGKLRAYWSSVAWSMLGSTTYW